MQLHHQLDTHHENRNDHIFSVQHNNSVNISLSKSISTPKRCHVCRKVVFFKSYRCKHCKHRHQHKKCSTKCCKNNGEEHWSKVLQANESTPYTYVRPGLITSQTFPQPCCPADPLAVSHSSSRHSTASSSASSADKNPGLTRQNSNILSSFVNKIFRWAGSSRHEGSNAATPHEVLCRISDVNSLNRSTQVQTWLYRQPQRSLSSEDSDLGSVSGGSTSTGQVPRCYSTTSSSSAMSSSTATDTLQHECTSVYDQRSDILHSNKTLTMSAEDTKWHRMQTVSHGSAYAAADDRCATVPLQYEEKSGLTASISHPLQSQILSSSFCLSPKGLNSTGEGARMCHSMEDTLSLGVKSSSSVKADESELDSSVFEESSYHDIPIRDTLVEFNIPYKDLEFTEKIRSGRRAEIHRGRWHGDVMIHTYSNMSEDEVQCFWKDVSKMALIRHENVMLFMGASLDPPTLAIITSVRKSKSLYEKIHIDGESLHKQRMRDVLLQVAHGMGYLHAKDILMTKLNSHNICLENNAKICLMDYGIPEAKFDSKACGCLPKGHLTYIAPEIMRTLRVECPRLVPSANYSSYTDIYAYGTVIYELVMSKYPFSQQDPEAVIWQVGSGIHQSLNYLKCNTLLKNLITKCWSLTPEKRPQFVDIAADLEYKIPLHKKHSSSEPELMNRVGSTICMDKSKLMNGGGKQ